MFYYGIDPTYILVIVGFLLSMLASSYVNRTYAKYDKVQNKKNYTGSQVAAFILKEADIHDVGIQQISGNLSDNYNAQSKVLSLSETVGPSTSVAAVGVAAHECGHAVQDKVGYVPLKLRAGLVPIVNFGAPASYVLIFIGVLLGQNQFLINVGILCFTLVLLFQLVTLPVEFNASRRALTIIQEGNLLDEEEMQMARKVLIAAALTYVASATATFLQLLRLFLLFGNNNRRD